MSDTYHHGRYRKRQLYGNDWWGWLKNEPRWWRKAYKHRKRRAEWRHRQTQIMHGADLDGMVYPKDKQPWVYYW